MPGEPVGNIRFLHGHHYPELIEETLSELKKQKIKIKIGDIIKSRFSDGNRTEWMWVKVIGMIGDRILGKLDNIPMFVGGVEYGEIVHVDPNLICGYYSHDGLIGIDPLTKSRGKK